MAAYLWTIVIRVLGIAAAVLPRRWWPRLDEFVPASSSALPSSVATLLAAALIGIPGFINHVSYTSEASASAAVAIVERNIQTRPELDNEGTLRQMAMSLNALSIFIFLLGTPLGLTASYLALSGLVRTAGALFDDPRGDPLLSLADAAICGARRQRRERMLRRHRVKLEGAEMPDRLISPAQAGVANCELVLVCSRRKAGWNTGTVLLTEEGQYRVKAIEDRTMGGWLRTLYALAEHKDQEAFRRTVSYNLPKRG